MSEVCLYTDISNINYCKNGNFTEKKNSKYLFNSCCKESICYNICAYLRAYSYLSSKEICEVKKELEELNKKYYFTFYVHDYKEKQYTDSNLLNCSLLSQFLFFRSFFSFNSTVLYNVQKYKCNFNNFQVIFTANTEREIFYKIFKINNIKGKPVILCDFSRKVSEIFFTVNYLYTNKILEKSSLRNYFNQQISPFEKRIKSEKKLSVLNLGFLNSYENKFM